MRVRSLITFIAALGLAVPGFATGDHSKLDKEAEQSKEVEQTLETEQSKEMKESKETEQSKAVIRVDSINKLLDNPSQFAGKKVTFDGEVEEVNGTQSFVVDGPGWWNDEVMVLTRKDLSEMKTDAAIADGAKVTLTGDVVAMSVVEIEREYGWDLQPEIEAELEGTQTFIVADDVKVTKAD